MEALVGAAGLSRGKEKEWISAILLHEKSFHSPIIA